MRQAFFLFHTTTSAIRGEKVLKKAGLTVKLVPTPRELSSDCGIALHIEAAQVGSASELLAAGKVEAELHYLEVNRKHDSS
jgi:hypothetical protein